MKTKILYILLILALFSSCASIYMNKSSDAAIYVVESLNRGDKFEVKVGEETGYMVIPYLVEAIFRSFL